MSYVGQVFASVNPIYGSQLNKAKELHTVLSADDVRQLTNWFKGKYDGKWRMEVTDCIDLSRFPFQEYTDRVLKHLVNKGCAYINDVVKDDEFLTAYPRIAAMEVQLVHAPQLHEEAEYTPAKNLIFAQAATVDALISCLVHEIQHAIQVDEGFAQGGVPDFFKRDSKGRYRPAKERHGDYWLLAGEIEARDAEARTYYTQDERKCVSPLSSEDHPSEAVRILYND